MDTERTQEYLEAIYKRQGGENYVKKSQFPGCDPYWRA